MTTITLRQLYAGEGIPEDEALYDLVVPKDIGVPLPVYMISPAQITGIKASYGGSSVVEIYHAYASPEQIEIVKDYSERIKTRKEDDADWVVVLKGDRVVDGNHRIVAAFLANVPIPCVDLNDLARCRNRK